MLAQYIVNNMNKILSIIIGIVVGLGGFWLMISLNYFDVAYGLVTQEEMDNVIIGENMFEWSDIFSPSKQGQNLYDLVYGKLLNSPTEEATKNIMQKYGMTIGEAEAIRKGTITALVNNPNTIDRHMTQQQIYNEYYAIQKDFNDFYELLKLKEELEVATKPSELFSNGDIMDSGFDLLRDLEIIEEILFLGTEPVTVSGSFSGSIDSPILENIYNLWTENSDTNTNSETLNSTGETSDLINRNETVDVNEQSPIQNENICIDESNLSETLNNYEEIVVENLENESAANFDGNQYDLIKDGEIQPAPADKWGSSWCSQLLPATSSANGYGYLAESNGFSSLSDIKDSVLNETLGGQAGFAAGNEDFKVALSVCLTTEFIKKTYVTYLPGESCVLCEIERINEFLNETVSHSLIPNKVSGSYMAPTKCTEAYQAPLIDMQVITIPAPISTPANYDLISETNIFEEWNSFVETYRPFLSDAGKIDADFNTDFVLKNIPGDATLEEAMREINAIQSKELSNALKMSDNITTATEVKNVKLYSQNLLTELKQMTALFESIQMLLKETDENACNMIKQLPTL